MQLRKAIVVGIILAAITLLSLPAMAVPDWMTRPGTIGHALSQPDGTTVSLDAVTVDKIRPDDNPPYFVIRECFDPTARLIVAASSSPLLKYGQTVDVSGTVTTLWNGERAIADAIIQGYTDRNGNLLYHGPMIKGLFEPNPWQWKTDLTEYSQVSANSAMSTTTTDDIPPPPGPSPEPAPSPAFCDSLNTVRQKSNGTFVELKCLGISSASSGQFVITDGVNPSMTVYKSGISVNATHRIVKLTATVHKDSNSTWLCVDTVQGDTPGQVLTAAPGTVAYAGTLSDGNWVYLTGQVVSDISGYWSNESNSAISSYNIQGPDGSGIRVLRTDSLLPYYGNIADFMGQVYTRDGQRILGISTSQSSVEYKYFVSGDDYYTMPKPIAMNNKALGGATFGNNPGIIDGFGLYNIGSYVRVFGKVTEIGTLSSGTKYVRIDDGSNVTSCVTTTNGLDSGVLVFGTDQYYDSNYISVGDSVAVSGLSSVWKPVGSSTTYRAVWVGLDGIVNLSDSSVAVSNVQEWGTISGNVKLYDMPSGLTSATVRIYVSPGKSISVTVPRDTDGTGSATYSITVPKRTDSIYYEYPAYILSAQCEGFKTRTFNHVTWDPVDTNRCTTRDIHLVPIKKLYLDSFYSVSPCTSVYTNVSATVRNADHVTLSGQTVRFRTTVGSFSENVLQPTTTTVTGSNGVATVRLYGKLWAGNGKVEATDDSTTPDPLDQGVSTDLYNYDWETADVSIAPPYVDVNVSSSKYSIARCGTDYATITANVTVCGNTPDDNTPVTFTIGANDPCVFTPLGTKSIIAFTSGGTASVSVKAQDINSYGDATITASSSVYAGSESSSTLVTVIQYNPIVDMSADPSFLTAPGTSTITINATDPDMQPISVPVTVKTTVGTFENGQNQILVTTDEYTGSAQATLTLTTEESAYVSATFDDSCLGPRTIGKTVVYAQPLWRPFGVNESSILVEDIIPGGNKEVAFTSLYDGKIHVCKADGALNGSNDILSSQSIDTYGNNTLSAADIDGRGGFELAAPVCNSTSMYVYGYDSTTSTLKPLAGWPAITPYNFSKVAAALGDLNLDGAVEVVAGDRSCYVNSWNSTGSNGFLWTQITQSTGTSISNSTVAIGDINPSLDNKHILDAVVGANTTPGLWGFAGDEWHNYVPGYNYTQGWQVPNVTNSVHCSPVIGKIDTDNYNDIAVGDDNGTMWVWLSSDSTWHSYNVSTMTIGSSPAIANLDGETCLVFGSDSGRVYAIHADGTPVTGWPANGIQLGDGASITASPLVGDVMNTGVPQVIVASTDGNVYVIWKDGNNHTGGPIAKIWSCKQSEYIGIYSTPALCSLDGTHLDLIVGSTDGIYRINFPSITYNPSEASRWQWTTFHYDNARTGCTTQPTSTLVSSSVIGRVKTSTGNGIQGASVNLEWYNNSTWVLVTSVYGRPDSERANPLTSAGSGSINDELNEGGFSFNQLTPGRKYRLVVSKTGYTTKTVNINSNQVISAQKYVQDVTL